MVLMSTDNCDDLKVNDLDNNVEAREEGLLFFRRIFNFEDILVN